MASATYNESAQISLEYGIIESSDAHAGPVDGRSGDRRRYFEIFSVDLAKIVSHRRFGFHMLKRLKEIYWVLATQFGIQPSRTLSTSLMDVASSRGAYCDSLSCLHALEHFGLGRYGDKIDPAGWRYGLSALARMIARGGTLYLSTPIGRERVVFNAKNVFSHLKLADAAKGLVLTLVGFSWIAGGEIVISRNFRG